MKNKDYIEEAIEGINKGLENAPISEENLSASGYTLSVNSSPEPPLPQEEQEQEGQDATQEGAVTPVTNVVFPYKDITGYKGITYLCKNFLRNTVCSSYSMPLAGKFRISAKCNLQEGVDYTYKNNRITIYNPNNLSEEEKLCIYGLYRLLSAQSGNNNKFREGMFKGLPEELLPDACNDWKGKGGVFIKVSPSSFAKMLGITGGRKFLEIAGNPEPCPYIEKEVEEITINDKGEQVLTKVKVKVRDKTKAEIDAERKGALLTLGQKIIGYTMQEGSNIIHALTETPLFEFRIVYENKEGKDGKIRSSLRGGKKPKLLPVYYLKLSPAFCIKASNDYITITSEEWENVILKVCKIEGGLDLFTKLRTFFITPKFKNEIFRRAFPNFLKEFGFAESYELHPQRVKDKLEDALNIFTKEKVIGGYNITYTGTVTKNRFLERSKGSRARIKVIEIFPPVETQATEQTNEA